MRQGNLSVQVDKAAFHTPDVKTTSPPCKSLNHIAFDYIGEIIMCPDRRNLHERFLYVFIADFDEFWLNDAIAFFAQLRNHFCFSHFLPFFPKPAQFVTGIFR